MTINSGLTFKANVYNKFSPLVYQVCFKFLMNKEYLDDAVQSVFLLYVEKGMPYREDLSSWFYWSSKNICKVINKKTINKNKEKSISDHEYSALENDSKDNAELVASLIDMLPKKKRDLILLKFYDQYSNREIGEILNKKEETIKKSLDRTIKFLQQKARRKDIVISSLLISFFQWKPLNAIAGERLISMDKLGPSLFQQSVVTGVLKMSGLSKLVAVGVMAISVPTIAYSTFLYAGDKKEEKVELVEKTEKDQNEVVDKSSSINELLKKLQTLVFFDFTNTGAAEGLEELSRLSGVDIVIDKKFRDSLNVKNGVIDRVANGMPLIDALKLIAKLFDGEVTVMNNSVHIFSKKSKEKYLNLLSSTDKSAKALYEHLGDPKNTAEVGSVLKPMPESLVKEINVLGQKGTFDWVNVSASDLFGELRDNFPDLKMNFKNIFLSANGATITLKVSSKRLFDILNIIAMELNCNIKNEQGVLVFNPVE